MNLRISLTVAVSVAALASCSSGSTNDKPASSTTTESSSSSAVTKATSRATNPSPAPATFELTECGFEVSGLVEGTDLRCGTVSVPMRNDTTETADLRVTVVGAANPTNADPVFHLPGGPGASAESYAPILGSFYGRLAAALGRNVVIVDQRGTGRSTPFLTCDDSSRLAACAAAWKSDGIDVAAFTTANAADDIAGVAASLGASSINVWGASYGSRLALEVARRHPEIVRSLTIESVDAIDTPFRKGEGGRAALAAIDMRCAADPACAGAVPDLAKQVDVVAAALQAEPLETAFGPVDGKQFIATLLGVMEGSTGASNVPMLTKAATDRDAATVGAIFANIAGAPVPGGMFSIGLNIVTNCSDLAGFDPANVLGTQPSPEALFDSALFDSAAASVSSCGELTGVTPAPTEPVKTSVATLVINGVDDSNTPLTNARIASETLTNSTLIAFPGFGHFPLHRGDSACSATVFVAFVNDPSAPVTEPPCVSGAASMPLALPGITGAALTDVAIASVGVTIGMPSGWLPAGETVRLGGGGTSMSVSTAPGKPDALIKTLEDQIGPRRTEASTVEVNRAPWLVMTFGPSAKGEVTAVGLTEAGPSTLIVAVAGPNALTAAIGSLRDSLVASVRPL